MAQAPDQRRERPCRHRTGGHPDAHGFRTETACLRRVGGLCAHERFDASEPETVAPIEARSSRRKAGQLWLCALALALAGGQAGYGLRARQETAGKSAPIQALKVDDILDDPSFSETESAIAALRASVVCFAGEVLARNHLLGSERAAVEGSDPSAAAANLSMALDELDWGREQYKGTGQEIFLVERMLGLLDAPGMRDRWLELYLRTLYEQPTGAFIGRHVRRALDIAREQNRTSELRNAWRLVLSLPLEFEAKGVVRAASAELPDEAGDTQVAARRPAAPLW